MTQSAVTDAPRNGRLLTLGSGGWTLLVASMLVLAVVAWRLTVIVHSRSILVVGDGTNVDSYGFDLSNCRVPRAQLVAAGFPKDGLPILNYPRALTLAGADKFNAMMKERHLGKSIVDKEAVLGVTIGDQPRAYPLRILTWHEVINDELGGTPIAITYNPLCNAAVVFDRRVGDETLEFGVSGLLYNSNLVMYDRRADRTGESLWSQLQFRAIAGPYADQDVRLRVLPIQIMRWQDWKTLHPDTTVTAPDLERVPLYKRTYAEYFGTDKLRFPVAPLPPANPAYKTPILAVRPAERWYVFAWEQIAQRVNAVGVWQTQIDGEPLRFVYRKDPALVGNPAAVWVELDDTTRQPAIVYSFWFAWYAQHPDEADLER